MITVCSRAKIPYAALEALSRGCECEYVDVIVLELTGGWTCECRMLMLGFEQERERERESRGCYNAGYGDCGQSAHVTIASW